MPAADPCPLAELFITPLMLSFNQLQTGEPPARPGQNRSSSPPDRLRFRIGELLGLIDNLAHFRKPSDSIGIGTGVILTEYRRQLKIHRTTRLCSE